MLRRLGRRSVLRVGYAAVIAVLILSALEAYRIQVNVSQQHIDIFYRYVDEEEGLTLLRRNLWLAGNYVRDFFISNTPEQSAVLASQLKSLEAEDDATLAHLQKSFPHNESLPKLRMSLAEFWALVDPVPTAMLGATREAQFEFVQRVIVPRRGELYNALLGLSNAGERRVQDSSQQIIAARHGAAQRLLLMLALSVLLGILVAVVSIRHSDNLADRAEKHYAEVEQAKGELQRLSARLLEVEEEGRRQLARELHDEIGQSLALLQIEISRAQAAASSGQPASLPERLERARALAEETVQTIRDISLLLRPTLLDDLGLAPALQFQVEQFLRRSGIACDYVEENVSDHLPDAVKTCVYRVVQEALHNCEKHSGATRVRVAVLQDPGFLRIEINDDGRGFLVNEKGMPSVSTGLGLLGMRERATIVGGSLEIDSAPGRGTHLSLRIPVPDSPVSSSLLAPAREVTA
jgi:signal transduction histidine kinase